MQGDALMASPGELTKACDEAGVKGGAGPRGAADAGGVHTVERRGVADDKDRSRVRRAAAQVQGEHGALIDIGDDGVNGVAVGVTLDAMDAAIDPAACVDGPVAGERALGILVDGRRSPPASRERAALDLAECLLDRRAPAEAAAWLEVRPASDYRDRLP